MVYTGYYMSNFYNSEGFSQAGTACLNSVLPVPFFPLHVLVSTGTIELPENKRYSSSLLHHSGSPRKSWAMAAMD